MWIKHEDETRVISQICVNFTDFFLEKMHNDDDDVEEENKCN
jgi:hypothetical protein